MWLIWFHLYQTMKNIEAVIWGIIGRDFWKSYTLQGVLFLSLNKPIVLLFINIGSTFANGLCSISLFWSMLVERPKTFK